MLSTRTRTDETLGNVLFFWCIELLCCLCTIFLSVGFFVTIHWFGFECHFNYIFIYLFFFWYTISTFTLVSYFLYFFFCCCITSFFNTGMHFYINSGFLLFCGGCSDLLVRFAFFILQLALCSGGVFCLEIYLIGSLCICCLLCSVYCLWHILLIYFTFIYLTFLISSI